MFFFRMISRALRRQLGKRVMIAVTICLGAALTTSMLAVMLDIGDKVTQELSSYGANIEVTPKGASVVSELYGTDDEPAGALKEEELPRLKSIFWAYNLEDFAPYLKTAVRTEAPTSDTGDITLLGTWFDYSMAIEVGQPVETGLMRPHEPLGRGLGDLVLHRLRVVDLLPDRGGADRRRGQARAPDRRLRGRHPREDPADHGPDRGARDGRLRAGIANLVTAGVMERAPEIGLAQAIGQMVFSSWITLRPLVLPVMAALVTAMILLGSLPSLRALMKLKPADVLHGK